MLGSSFIYVNLFKTYRGGLGGGILWTRPTYSPHLTYELRTFKNSSFLDLETQNGWGEILVKKRLNSLVFSEQTFLFVFVTKSKMSEKFSRDFVNNTTSQKCCVHRREGSVSYVNTLKCSLYKAHVSSSYTAEHLTTEEQLNSYESVSI